LGRKLNALAAKPLSHHLELFCLNITHPSDHSHLCLQNLSVTTKVYKQHSVYSRYVCVCMSVMKVYGIQIAGLLVFLSSQQRILSVKKENSRLMQTLMLAFTNERLVCCLCTFQDSFLYLDWYWYCAISVPVSAYFNILLTTNLDSAHGLW